MHNSCLCRTPHRQVVGQQNSMECRSEVILVGRRVQGSSPRGHLSPWYYVWLEPTLSVIQFQEHLTHLFTLRANCPIFPTWNCPSCDIFPIAMIYLSSQQALPSQSCSGGWLGWRVGELFSHTVNKGKFSLNQKFQSNSIISLTTHIG